MRAKFLARSAAKLCMNCHHTIGPHHRRYRAWRHLVPAAAFALLLVATAPATAGVSAPAAPGAEAMARSLEAAGVDPAQVPDENAVIIVKPERSGPSLDIVFAGVAGALCALGLLLVLRQRPSAVRAGTEPSRAPAEPPPPAEPVPEAYLVDVNRVTSRDRHAIGERALMIGRVAGAAAEYLDYLVINTPTIGRQHAVVKFQDQAFWVVDQGSMNGTFVNGERLTAPRRLRHGDEVRCHSVVFRVEIPGEIAAGEGTVLAASANPAEVPAEAIETLDAPVFGLGELAGVPDVDADETLPGMFVPPLKGQPEEAQKSPDETDMLSFVDSTPVPKDSPTPPAHSDVAPAAEPMAPDEALEDFFDITGENMALAETQDLGRQPALDGYDFSLTHRNMAAGDSDLSGLETEVWEVEATDAPAAFPEDDDPEATVFFDITSGAVDTAEPGDEDTAREPSSKSE